MRKKNLFKFASCKMPLNLQFFAEESGDSAASGGGSGSEGQQEDGQGEEQSGKPSYEDLIEKLAQLETRAKNAEAENERQKTENTRLSGEKDRLKEQLTAKMTAEEQLDEAKKEAQEAINKRLEEAEKELAIGRATKRYMSLKMDENSAEEMARLEFSGDMDAVIKKLAKHIESIEKKASEDGVNKFLASRPDIKAGNGDAEKTSLAVEKAKEFSNRGSRSVNADALKIFQ